MTFCVSLDWTRPLCCRLAYICSFSALDFPDVLLSPGFVIRSLLVGPRTIAQAVWFRNLDSVLLLPGFPLPPVPGTVDGSSVYRRIFP